MRVSHSLTVRAKCPMDDQIDIYQVTVEADRVVKVEDIIQVAERFAARQVFQEDLTVEMARALGATVKTVGWHSGVRTEVTA